MPKTNLYYCKSCNKLVKRDSKKKWIESVCEKTNQKVRITLVTPKTKIKVYEVDGDACFRTMNINDVLGWIETDVTDAKLGEVLSYQIRAKMITKQQFDNSPEWDG